MKPGNKICFFLLLFISQLSYAQIDNYAYSYELQGITEQWHRIVLPDEIFGDVSPELSDIRIFGITLENDTIEAPYILHLTSEKISSIEVEAHILNQSHNERGYYFTFEIPARKIINHMELDFKQENFDWRLNLEGSQEQQEWYTIVENYRILSIRNSQTNYQFTRILFPESRYAFYRIHIMGKNKPDLKTVKVSLQDTVEGLYRTFTFKDVKTKNDKQSKFTEIDIDLHTPAPVNHLDIHIKDTFDYYRPVTLRYLSDSFNTDQGWKYNYHTLSSGTLNSMEKNEFQFNSTILQKLKIVIQNYDNEPLKINHVEVKGNVYELVARFTEPANYYLVYGNREAGRPNYDIDRFFDKAPEELKPLTLGERKEIVKEKSPGAKPLFINKIWLWAVMIVIIVSLGWFSISMMRKK